MEIHSSHLVAIIFVSILFQMDPRNLFFDYDRDPQVIFKKFYLFDRQLSRTEAESRMGGGKGPRFLGFSFKEKGQYINKHIV